jgi:hypothetical protein
VVELEACRDHGLVISATQDVADQSIDLVIPQNPAVGFISPEQLQRAYMQQSAPAPSHGLHLWPSERGGRGGIGAGISTFV